MVELWCIDGIRMVLEQEFAACWYESFTMFILCKYGLTDMQGAMVAIGVFYDFR